MATFSEADASAQETLAVLSDDELLADHLAGRAATDAGDHLDAVQLAHTMREAARPHR